MDEVHAALLLQIGEHLRLVAGDQIDLGHAGFFQLADLPLDEHLSLNRDQRLGHLIGEGSKAAGGTRRHNDGVIDFWHKDSPSCYDQRNHHFVDK